MRENKIVRHQKVESPDQLKASLETRLLGRGSIDFEFNGYPATIRVAQRDDDYFQYESEVETRFVNHKGNMDTKPTRCISRVLNGVLEQVPEVVLRVVESRLLQVETSEFQQSRASLDIARIRKTGQIPRSLRRRHSDSF